MWRSRWRCVIKPAYSVSFLLSITIFVWQNLLYFLDAPRILILTGPYILPIISRFLFHNSAGVPARVTQIRINSFNYPLTRRYYKDHSTRSLRLGNLGWSKEMLRLARFRSCWSGTLNVTVSWCYVVLTGKYLPTLRKTLLPPPSGPTSLRRGLLTFSSKYRRMNAKKSDCEWRSVQNLEEIDIGLQDDNHTWQLPNAKHGCSLLGAAITWRYSNYVTRQKMYVQCNIKERSCNHCYSGRVISITYSERVSLASGIQHAMYMSHIVICHPPGCTKFLHIIS